MSGFLIVERVLATLSQRDDVVQHERPRIKSGERVVNGLAADVTCWLVLSYTSTVLVAYRTVPLRPLSLHVSNLHIKLGGQRHHDEWPVPVTQGCEMMPLPFGCASYCCGC